MIITISGAGCTGKTTLVNAIKDKYHMDPKIHYHGEYIRVLFDKYYKDKYHDFETFLEEASPSEIINLHTETAIMFMNTIIESPKGDVLIFDRCPLDIGIYLYMNLAKYLDNPTTIEMYKNAVHLIRRHTEDFLEYQPHMFYVRLFQSTVEQDGFRPLSLINRRDTELALFDKEFMSIRSVKILPSDLDLRVSTISMYIDYYNQRRDS